MNSKQKGARGEREVCKLLFDYWSPFEPKVDGHDLTFKRTPMSGGWSHGKGRETFGTAADILTNSKTFPWAVEIKHRESFSMDNVEKGKKSPVWGWWKQACRQANEMNKEPMLLFRKNRMPWHLMARNQWVFDGDNWLFDFPDLPSAMISTAESFFSYWKPYQVSHYIRTHSERFTGVSNAVVDMADYKSTCQRK